MTPENATPESRSPARQGSAPRPAYTAPALERLGAWSALTLQQSVCTGDGCAMVEAARLYRLV